MPARTKPAPAAAPAPGAASSRAGIVNEARGELALVLEGTAYGLRPSYEAIVAIEAATGLTIGTMAMAAASMRLPLDKLGLVAAELIRAWGRATGNRAATAVDPGRVGQLIFDAGLLAGATTIAKVLNGAVTGGYTALGEARPAKATTGSATTAP